MKKITVDVKENAIISTDEKGEETRIPLYSQEGFKLLSAIWLKQEWNQLHWQSFSWMGFPILQFPEDLLRLQEVIVSLKPDVIIETGTYRCGTAIFFASLCRLAGKGRVISIDKEIASAARQAVEQSSFSDLITLIEGDSTSDDVIKRIRNSVKPDKKVFVFLDSDHSKTHVLHELNAYAAMVTPESYIVAADGVMRSLADTPRGHKEWKDDNPTVAAQEFVKNHPEFKIERPQALFNDQCVVEELTYWPGAWIKRIGKQNYL